MRFLPSLLILALLSCKHETSVSLGPEQTEAAFISDNYLYVDGCESYVRLDRPDSTGNGIFYKPTTSTLPILQQALTIIPATKIPPNEPSWSGLPKQAIKLHYIAAS